MNNAFLQALLVDDFAIKVLETWEGAVKGPEIIKAVDDAPEQYPCYEEEEGWEDEEGWEEE